MPQQPLQNTFMGGMVKSMHPYVIPQDRYYHAEDIRLVDADGNGYIVTNAEGNQYKFQVTEGYQPIGAAEFGGTLYIVSAYNGGNPAFAGYSEIGTYPSPTVLNAGGFTAVYNPLQNYTLANYHLLTYRREFCDPNTEPTAVPTQSFTDVKLGLRCAYPCEVRVRPDYDGSVNIYFTDGENPFRVINSGFNWMTGQYDPFNRRYTSQYDIANVVNVVNGTDSPATVILSDIQQGGVNKYGNYIIFVRYTTEEYASTDFVTSSNPIVISNFGDLIQPVSFAPGDRWIDGGDGLDSSTQMILLDIGNIDQDYKYFEIAFMRWYNGVYESKLINIRYDIQALLVGAPPVCPVIITGREPLVDITDDELIAFKPADARICKSIRPSQNYLYQANLKGITLDPGLQELFCKIVIDEEIVERDNNPEIEATGFPGIQTSGAVGNAIQVFEEASYHSAETYCFAAVPFFKDGTFSPVAFPLEGHDNIDLNPATKVNSLGIYRFSSCFSEPYAETVAGAPDKLKVRRKLVKFDSSAALTWWNANASDPVYAWIHANLAGWYYVRAKRKKNKMYSGLVLECGPDWDLENLMTANDAKFVSKRIAPLMDSRAFGAIANGSGIAGGTDVIYTDFGYEDGFYSPQFTRRLNRHGLVSPDYIIDGASDKIDRNNFIVKLSVSQVEPLCNPTAPGNIYPSVTEWYPDLASELVWTDDSNGPVAVARIKSVHSSLRWCQINIDMQAAELDGSYAYTRTSVKTCNVKAWDLTGVGTDVGIGGGFTSKYSQGEGEDGQGTPASAVEGSMWVCKDMDGNDHFAVNMPMAMPAYIGIEGWAPNDPGGTGNSPNRVQRSHAALYITNPHSVTFDILDWYDFQSERFYRIGTPFMIADFVAGTNLVCAKGDCFTQFVAIKTLYAWNGFKQRPEGAASGYAIADYLLGPLTMDGCSVGVSNGYGQEIEFPCECDHNYNLLQRKGGNTTFQRNPTLAHINEYDLPESVFYNLGYSETLDLKGWIGISLSQPVQYESFTNRVRVSFPQVAGAIRDQWRIFAPASFKDYGVEFGPINRLCMNSQQLYAILRDAVLSIPINERAAAGGSEGSAFVLGVGSLLPAYRNDVEVYLGGQHQWGICESPSGIYGVDVIRRAIWRARGGALEDISFTKGMDTWLRTYLDTYWSLSYSVDPLADKPICGEGVWVFYDPEQKEVLTAFVSSDRNVERFTLAFSEKIDAFTSFYKFFPSFWANLGDMLFTVPKTQLPRNDFWLHGHGSDRNSWYDSVKIPTIWFYVNQLSTGIPEDKMNNVEYEAQALAINGEDGSNIQIAFMTERQISSLDFATAPFWLEPRWTEDGWSYALPRAQSLIGSAGPQAAAMYAIGSSLRGRYLMCKITVTSQELLALKEVITFILKSST